MNLNLWRAGSGVIAAVRNDRVRVIPFLISRQSGISCRLRYLSGRRGRLLAVAGQVVSYYAACRDDKYNDTEIFEPFEAVIPCQNSLLLQLTCYAGMGIFVKAAEMSNLTGWTPRDTMVHE